MEPVYHQFHYQMDGKPNFIDNVSSYRVKFTSQAVIVVEVTKGNELVTLSLPTSCVWRTSAKDTTDWKNYE